MHTCCCFATGVGSRPRRPGSHPKLTLCGCTNHSSFMQHNTPIVLNNELYCAIHHVDDINKTSGIYAALKTIQCSTACVR